jgi:hypothetical protein
MWLYIVSFDPMSVSCDTTYKSMTRAFSCIRLAVSKSHHNVDSDWKTQQGNSPVNIKMRLKFGRWLLLDPTYLNGNLFEILQTFWGIQRIKNIYKSDLTNNNLSLWRWCIWPFFYPQKQEEIRETGKGIWIMKNV